MPYFRERTFAGVEGRPAIPIINIETANYESSDKDKHLDWALRWAHSVDEYEIALSWFQGTSRDPLLMPSSLQITAPELVPYYQQINQLGFELQANLDDLLWKLEIIHRDSNLEQYWALQGGFEYSQYSVMNSSADLGWLLEYSWDERGEHALSNFQNDVFLGARLALNDIDSTELLAGLSYDIDFNSSNFLIEASRRFGNSFKFALDVRIFNVDNANDVVYAFRKDDHIQLTAQYYY